jgi:hypothetical protein
MDPAHDRRVADVHAPLGHQGDEIAIAQAIGKVPANAAFDDFTRKPPTPVYGITLNGLGHGPAPGKAPRILRLDRQCTRTPEIVR